MAQMKITCNFWQGLEDFEGGGLGNGGWGRRGRGREVGGVVKPLMGAGTRGVPLDPAVRVAALAAAEWMKGSHSVGGSAGGSSSGNGAIPSYQRPFFQRKREGNVRFPTNLHGDRRSARPTSR